MPNFRVVWDELTTVEATFEADSAEKAIELAQEHGYQLEIDRGHIAGSFRADESEQ